jgi:hypothetical protein
MKQSFLYIGLAGFLLVLTSCKKKKDINFTLTQLTVNNFPEEQYPAQNISVKVVCISENDTLLAQTGVQSSKYSLPAVYTVEPKLIMNFYHNDYVVQLWGDSSGLMGSNPIHLKDYKIIYPIEMETENNGVTIGLKGTWK